MTKHWLHIILLFVSITSLSSKNLWVDGQLSVWANYNIDHDLPLWAGGQYIPSLQWKKPLKNEKLFDLEFAINVNGSLGTHPFDSIEAEGKLRPYRSWFRYSSTQFEIRLGLQKINFGSASLLRPLMWFDQLDPRDPLQRTDGVWGLLGRYYFMNNANAWLWVLYGNEKNKTWELGRSSQKLPEAGGRFQMPIPKGEGALSYHFRGVDTKINNMEMPYNSLYENRIGLDAKWDIEIGLWLEAAWINKNRNVGEFTNQEIINIGADYTFGLGNGLNVTAEHFMLSYDEKAFRFDNLFSFTALSLSYPVGINDNLSLITYYDWDHNDFYNMLNWKHQFKKIAMYVLGYLNPEQNNMPQISNNGQNLFGGKGIQLMFVYNH